MFEAYKKGLSKAKDFFKVKLDSSEDYYENLEESLISFDVSYEVTNKIISVMKKNKLNLKDSIKYLYKDYDPYHNRLNFSEDLTVYLFVGINGVGKTTTIAKLANQYSHKKTLLIAADTFRAGAKEQLKKWGEELNIEVFAKDVSDPSAVIYEGLEYAKSNNFELVFIDTAGRLQNKEPLMQEMDKMNRTIYKVLNKYPEETLLVIDATQGQNALFQAEYFNEVVKLTGIVITKLDGTAKGGIIFSIKEKVNLFPKLIGLGEDKEDLRAFDLNAYVDNMMED